MKFIESFEDFYLNETLKTTNIDLTYKHVKDELSLLKYDFDIVKNDNNTIDITLNNVNKTQIFSLLLDNLSNLMTDRYGWFPSKMKMTNISDMENTTKYDANYLKKTSDYLKSITITYEAKYDKLIGDIPNKIYHLSIQEFENKIKKIGLTPKAKNKLTNHLDRIYFCFNEEDCRKLINCMKLALSDKSIDNKINAKWILYEIDTTNLNLNLYQDPNYKKGFYCVNNIPTNNIKIIDKEN